MDGVPFLFNFSPAFPPELKTPERKNPDTTNCRGFTQIES